MERPGLVLELLRALISISVPRRRAEAAATLQGGVYSRFILLSNPHGPLETARERLVFSLSDFGLSASLNLNAQHVNKMLMTRTYFTVEFAIGENPVSGFSQS